MYLTNNYFGHGADAAVDIEPTSNGSVVDYVWFDANTFGPNDNLWFANHGVNATISRIYFTNNTLNRAMNVDSMIPTTVDRPTLGTPGTFRRSGYEFTGNISTVANGVSSCPNQDTPPQPPPTDQRQMRFIGVTDLLVDGNRQPLVAGDCQFLVRADYVDDAVVEANVLHNAINAGYYTHSNICEPMDNQIGDPLAVQTTVSPGGTPC